MRRLLIGGVMTALLIVCLATGALWIRSYFRVDVAHDTDMWQEGANWYWRDRIVRSERGGVDLSLRGCLLTNLRWANKSPHKPGHRSITAHMPGELGPGRRFPGFFWFDVDRRSRFHVDPRTGPWLGPIAMPEFIYQDDVKVYVAYWPIVLLSGLPPAVWFMRRRRAKRRIACGHCVRCGYDLRETPDRCPECGQLAGERGSRPLRLGSGRGGGIN